MTKKKATMSQVLADIKPYITKKFMAAPCIKAVSYTHLDVYKRQQFMSVVYS